MVTGEATSSPPFSLHNMNIHPSSHVHNIFIYHLTSKVSSRFKSRISGWCTSFSIRSSCVSHGRYLLGHNKQDRAIKTWNGKHMAVTIPQQILTLDEQEEQGLLAFGNAINSLVSQSGNTQSCFLGDSKTLPCPLSFEAPDFVFWRILLVWMWGYWQRCPPLRLWSFHRCGGFLAI